MERFDPRGCHLRTSEIMHLFSQHMTKTPLEPQGFEGV